LSDIYHLIYFLEKIYYWMIIIYILMSWLPSVRESFIGDILGRLVEPYLRPFRRLIPPIRGVIDVSPIVALIALEFVVRGLIAVISYFE
jgi:YggT family protein